MVEKLGPHIPELSRRFFRDCCGLRKNADSAVISGALLARVLSCINREAQKIQNPACHFFRSIAVIRRAGEDGLGAVELLEGDDQGEFVLEGLRTEGPKEVGCGAVGVGPAC